MPPLLSIIIPIAPYHSQVATQAIVSANSQTIPCDVIVIEDTESRGASWARNQGIKQAKGIYVTFLDADDIITPNFAEICLDALAHYAQSHTGVRYAYTDWTEDGVKPVIAPLPCIAWTEHTGHLVTAIVPTERARLIGGFDENMTGLEDVDFYLRLRLSGVCGLHIHSPSNPSESALVHYREGGQRAIAARLSGQEILAKQYMTNRYGGYSLMGCCGNSDQHPLTPDNEPEPGDVLAQAQWQGNVRRLGLATGRMYLRTSYPKLLYMAPADIAAAPHMWKAVSAPVQASNGVVLQPQYAAQSADIPWQQTMDAVFGGGNPQAPSKPIEYKPNTPGLKKADVLAKGKSK